MSSDNDNAPVPASLPATPPPLPGSEQQQQPLVRCDVTGKLVAAEDAVEFRGRTVSAEGKEILVRQLLDGTADQPGTLTRPGFFRRFLCYLLDGVALFAISLPISVIALAQEPDGAVGPVAVTVQVLSVLCTLLYPTIMHGAWGKTIGKMAGHFRVVNLDGSPVSYGTAAVRAFWSNAVLTLPALVTLFAPGVGMAASGLIGLYGLVNSLALLADSDMNRALHDRLAGTRVVMDKGY